MVDFTTLHPFDFDRNLLNFFIVYHSMMNVVDGGHEILKLAHNYGCSAVWHGEQQHATWNWHKFRL